MAVSNEARCKMTVLSTAVAFSVSSLNVLCERSAGTSYGFTFIRFLDVQTHVSYI